MSSTTVFVLGATGYIGGAVLVDLKKRHPEFVYTALVRNPKDNAAIEALGVKVVNGSHADLDTIEKQAAASDIVLNFADADDLPLTNAILNGLTARAESGQASRKPILLHTSGTGLLTGWTATRDFIPGVIDRSWDDSKVEDIKSIPEKAAHRDVDEVIFKAGEKGLIDTYIIAPSTIYGKGHGPVRNISIQVNELIKVALQQREVLIIRDPTKKKDETKDKQNEDGKNVWGSVHIKDLSDLYLRVLDLAISGKDKETDPYAHFYFGTSDEYAWGDVAAEVAKLLKEQGLVDKDTPTYVDYSLDNPDPRLTRRLGSSATTSRSVATRGHALGWKPAQKSLLETLPEEIELTKQYL